jgi:hypothetical protein
LRRFKNLNFINFLKKKGYFKHIGNNVCITLLIKEAMFPLWKRELKNKNQRNRMSTFDSSKDDSSLFRRYIHLEVSSLLIQVYLWDL